MQDRQSRMTKEHAGRPARPTLLAAERRIRPFQLDAMVLMPQHVHLLITLPENDADNTLSI